MDMLAAIDFIKACHEEYGVNGAFTNVILSNQKLSSVLSSSSIIVLGSPFLRFLRSLFNLPQPTSSSSFRAPSIIGSPFCLNCGDKSFSNDSCFSARYDDGILGLGFACRLSKLNNDIKKVEA